VLTWPRKGAVDTKPASEAPACFSSKKQNFISVNDAAVNEQVSQGDVWLVNLKLHFSTIRIACTMVQFQFGLEHAHTIV
jgi:hypothetical protein